MPLALSMHCCDCLTSILAVFYSLNMNHYVINVILFHVPVTVRLVNGTNAWEGRVEVLYNSTWGTICGGWRWDISAANVSCRMLGYPAARHAYSHTSEHDYGRGSGPIWLSSLACTGNEVSLSECSHREWGNIPSSCDHSRDVGVECKGRYYLYELILNLFNVQVIS